MAQKRKLRDESDSRGEDRLTYANHKGRRPLPKRRMSHIPNESSSSWFKTATPREGDEETGSDPESGPETEDPVTSLAIGELQKPGGGAIRGSIDYAERSKRPRNTDLDQLLYSPPSKKCEQTNLETDDSGFEIQSDEDSKKSYNYSNSLVEPARKIYLAPDRYAEHIAKIKRRERLKQRSEDEKKRKPWERRSISERGPRAGRSDEFLTKEEARYAENIIRAAARHRLETWHRERHEMWGLKAIEVQGGISKEMKGLEEGGGEGDSAEGGMQPEKEPDNRSGAGLGTLLKAASIRQEDMEDDATIKDILQGIPNPLDPCFYTPADTIFLPRIPKFTEVVFSLEYHLGYTRKQVRWLMGGARAGRGTVPSTNTIGMRLQRYMRKNGLMDAAKAAPTRTVERSKTPGAGGTSTANSGNGDHKGSTGEAEQASHLLPHGPRIRRPEFGVHGWVWDHPHEIRHRLEDHH